MLLTGSFPHRPLDRSLRIPLGDGLPLVVQLLPARDPDINLGSSIAQSDPERHQGHPLPLGRLLQLLDLASMHQELSRPPRIVVGVRTMTVWRHIGADQPKFRVVDADVRLANRHLAISNGLDLGASQRESRLQSLVDEIVVVGSFVLRHHSISGWRRHRCT